MVVPDFECFCDCPRRSCGSRMAYIREYSMFPSNEKCILNGVADHGWSRLLWNWLGSRLCYSDWYHLRDNWIAGRV